MGLMRAHKALLDTATRVVQLNSPLYGTQVLQLSAIPMATLQFIIQLLRT
jgi:hypothetical protein